MANEQRNGETLNEYRERLRREFRERYPELVKYSSPEPWDESDDIFLEALTGEKLEPRRES
ncbi:MAG TPA: hypothetical protein VHZ54_16545 [Solirubrobacterales bacterium]|jgi:hypothetical protein|nr:hypothetical protein [Solirubrobacterales bacterium]